MGLVPRVHTSPRSLVPSPRREAVPFALADAHSRLQSAPWVGHRAASRCRRLQGSLLLRGVRGIVGRRARYERIRRFVVPTSTRHAADATPDSTNGGNWNHTKAGKNNDQGTSTLLSTPTFYAPRRFRVLRSQDTMSSHPIRVPRLRQNSDQFHDLEIFRHCRSCAPRGRPLQLRYKVRQNRMYNVQV